MIFYIKSYLQFLWHSKNEHGVHSPFVFHLLTKCFYNKKIEFPQTSLLPYKKINSKKTRLLYKIIKYFSPKSILIVGATPFVKEVIELANPNCIIERDIESAIYNCIYSSFNNNFYLSNEIIERFLKTVENDSFWVLEGIYSSAESEMMWKTLKSHPKVKVTVDTFGLGLVFFRREQEKEHFIIRA